MRRKQNLTARNAQLTRYVYILHPPSCMIVLDVLILLVVVINVTCANLPNCVSNFSTPHLDKLVYCLSVKCALALTPDDRRLESVHLRPASYKCFASTNVLTRVLLNTSRRDAQLAATQRETWRSRFTSYKHTMRVNGTESQTNRTHRRHKTNRMERTHKQNIACLQ